MSEALRAPPDVVFAGLGPRPTPTAVQEEGLVWRITVDASGIGEGVYPIAAVTVVDVAHNAGWWIAPNAHHLLSLLQDPALKVAVFDALFASDRRGGSQGRSSELGATCRQPTTRGRRARALRGTAADPA